ncbi:MAG: aminotransferase class V-fold PLP-dependent enzyme [Synergistaceae bacterium]|jgi:selenocysteine lyase/cysteine desulfurase|nr:aminotransferase class V-fold PLP-dependent enzyme [Synergistaceae bacterium]
MSVYLNNAATTWPKPPCVSRAVADFIISGGASLARGTASERDMKTLSLVLECRILLARRFGGFENGDPRYVTFCSGVTEALNLVLKGFLSFCSSRRSSHEGRPLRVLSSQMEHNAVVRPLRGLERQGVRTEFLPCDPDGFLRPETVKEALAAEKADLMVLSHASNVCGTIQPLPDIAELCGAFDVPLVVDAAQTAGALSFGNSFEKEGEPDFRAADWNLAALCFTGHKGLMGPQGTGGVLWRPDFAERTAPLVEGGTGSFSQVEFQPSDMPDKFEAGTPNLPGIAGLYASLLWLEETGVKTVERREREMGERLLEGLKEIDGAVLGGRSSMEGRLPVFSVNFREPDVFNKSGEFGEFVDNGVLADRLSQEGFETRPGLHCAPLAHRTLGTFPQGSLRVSPGYFNEPEDIDAFLEAVKRCIREN